jgi:SEC-C motif-containing protein
MNSMSPAELIAARCRAFTRGDFGFIYDSFHSASNFRRHFSDRGEYQRHGRSVLSQDFEIVSWRILAEKVEPAESQVLFLVEMRSQGQVGHYAERAWLRFEGDGWRYHRGQKLSGDELPEDPTTLCFTDFAGLDPATIF